MYSDEKARSLAHALLIRLEEYERELLTLSIAATGNSEADTLADLRSSRQFLQQFERSTLPQMRKPKGSVLVMLSFNEPLLVSVVPIFCALVCGNQLRVRPSSKNRQLFDTIWLDLIKSMDLDMRILQTEIEAIESEIRDVMAVYFFGSHANARKLYVLCAKHFVEFIPEIETADVKVLYCPSDSFDAAAIDADIQTTLSNAFEHGGKICQRLSGLYVNSQVYPAYIERLHTYLSDRQFEVKEVPADEELKVLQDIRLSNPERVYVKNGQIVVIHPETSSDFTQGGYFYESLWVRPYDDEVQLMDELNARSYFMGINIRSDNQTFIGRLIAGTRFSRYTLTDTHCDISKDSGWGGNWPSGTGGYKDWFETFSTAYAVIR